MPATTKIFTTLSDARAQLNGTENWTWCGGSSHDGFIKFAYANQDQFRVTLPSDDIGFNGDAALRAYLISVGEQPSDYSL